MNKDSIEYILVYKANSKGYPGTDGNTTMPASCAGYDSCVKFKWSEDAKAFRYANGTWKSTTVNACAGQSDAVGIYLRVKHHFTTGLFPDKVTVDDRAVGKSSRFRRTTASPRPPSRTHEGLRSASSDERGVAAVIVSVFVASLLFGLVCHHRRRCPDVRRGAARPEGR